MKLLEFDIITKIGGSGALLYLTPQESVYDSICKALLSAGADANQSVRVEIYAEPGKVNVLLTVPPKVSK